ncbi:MAG: histidinol-phosphate transaminase [Spirochaetales bacterium]|nr:histidinol-phosphate transaminase [Spirochaetales bacterium]
MKLREDLADLPPYAAGKLKPGAIKLASNENPWGPSPLAIEAVKAHLDRSHIYPDGGAQALKSAIAEHWSLLETQITVGNGSDEVLSLIAGAYIRPGDNALIANHTFSEYQFSVRLFGGTLKKVPLTDYTFDLEAFSKAVDEKTRIVFLCNPNNPTGTYFSHEALERFLEKLSPEILVVLDEAYAHYADAPDFPRSKDLLARFANLVVLRTFSKVYGLAALRVGYAVSSSAIARDLSVVRQPFNVGSLSQAAAQAALGDEAFLTKSLETNRTERDRLTREFGRSLRVLPSQANFLAVHVKTDSAAVFQALAEAGVTIRPLASFGMPDWVRITVGTPEQNDFLLKAWNQLGLS